MKKNKQLAIVEYLLNINEDLADRTCKFHSIDFKIPYGRHKIEELAKTWRLPGEDEDEAFRFTSRDVANHACATCGCLIVRVKKGSPEQLALEKLEEERINKRGLS